MLFRSGRTIEHLARNSRAVAKIDCGGPADGRDNLSFLLTARGEDQTQTRQPKIHRLTHAQRLTREFRVGSAVFASEVLWRTTRFLELRMGFFVDAEFRDGKLVSAGSKASADAAGSRVSLAFMKIRGPEVHPGRRKRLRHIA